MVYVNYTELRQNLARYMDEVCDRHAPLVVTRQNARPVVLISQEEYDRMAETLHLMRSPRNALRLLQAMENTQAGRLIERKLMLRATTIPTPAPKPTWMTMSVHDEALVGCRVRGKSICGGKKLTGRSRRESTN
jgi:antitoxin YefM